MARFLLIGLDGVEVRAVDAPDVHAAKTRLGPRGGQFVVSAASWAVSQLVRVPDPEREGPSPYKGRPRVLTDEQRAENRRATKRRMYWRKVQREKSREITGKHRHAIAQSNIRRGIEQRRARVAAQRKEA